MKLPNVTEAVVPKEKITDYLLSLTHSSGKGKAAFFLRMGFRVEAWQIFAQALLNHAAEYEVSKAEPSPFGMRYVIEGELLTPEERKPFVRAVWFIETEGVVPRFVTAYPVERSE